jgi:hypothetical protein
MVSKFGNVNVVIWINEITGVWWLKNALQQIMVYLIGEVNKKSIILTFGQFDHLVILDKSI